MVQLGGHYVVSGSCGGMLPDRIQETDKIAPKYKILLNLKALSPVNGMTPNSFNTEPM